MTPTERHPMAMKRVVYEISGMEAAPVRRDVEYSRDAAGALTMDLYYPARTATASPATALPAIVFVVGFPDAGFQTRLGCRFMDMASSVSWAQLMAASGIVAVTYTSRQPAADVHAVLDYVRRNAGPLGVDGNSIGLFASSGHGPLALSVLMGDARAYLKCAILCYPYTLDVNGASGVGEAARTWGFANPCAGRRVEELQRDIPMLIARAGGDEMPGLNDALDRFIAKALACNLPVTVVNEPGAVHAFDLLQDSDASRGIVERILAFARVRLSD